MDKYKLPTELRQVQVVHVLDNGQFITNHQKFENEYKDFFNANKNQIINEIIRLRTLTKSWNKSILYIKTNGKYYSKTDVDSEQKP